ncbi:MAG: DUF6017 domain-containing protein [Ruminococcus sp.]|nr:DUF6017 domain-containing protein [Ruminococcus sp.]
MPKLRKEFTQDFTIIYNTILRDKRVGSSPRGVYCTMVSMSDGWNFTIRGLAAVMGEGVTKIANALKKLEETKYLKRERVYEKGRIVDWEYFIYDEPYEAPDEDQSCDSVESPAFMPLQDADLQDTELLDTENLNQGQSHLENQDAYKITIKEESKKEKSMEEESIYQSAPAAQQTVENSADDRQMDGYVSEKAVYTDVVKQNIEFFDFAEWLKDESEAEEIVQMIVRQICSRKPTERICGQEFPREVVKSAMLKVDIEVLQNAIEQMERIDNVRNFESYLISTLFNEANSKRFRDNAESRWAEYAVKRDFGGYND